MNELTPLQRYSVYSKMLTAFERENKWPPCFCYYLTYMFNVEELYAFPRKVSITIDMLPELMSRKPQILVWDSYWFRPNVKQPRIKILKEAIEEVLTYMPIGFKINKTYNDDTL